ncbi:putative quinol monooxygenase [Roseivirga sp. BDSF3-8]|uniref:putative quinol monooxygenase n=1 Tax=Roseivirga sp. BDSF3-8 TaxID=3241598 RepID=UPI003531E63A
MKAQNGKGEELAAILKEASDLMQNAKGCHLYLVALDAEERDLVRITEVWDSKEDHDNSLNYPGVHELIGRAMPLMDGPPKKGVETIVLGGVKK